MEYFWVRFSQRRNAPTLHRVSCPDAQFVVAKPKQDVGRYESGDALRNLNAITSAKAYQVLDNKYPGKVRVCSCTEGSALKAVLRTVVSR